MLLQHARAAARIDADGAPVLLEVQDRARWDRRAITEGLALVDKALRHRRPGPYQVQAAIAALHARAPRFADTDWAQIDLLYGTLERMQPSPVVTLNRAVAVSMADGPEVALPLVEGVADALSGFRPLHAVRGELLERIGDPDAAADAFLTAADLPGNSAEATILRRRADALRREV
jgi:RNA polymerase sigma-70 factor (ECF subfamily)